MCSGGISEGSGRAVAGGVKIASVIFDTAIRVLNKPESLNWVDFGHAQFQFAFDVEALVGRVESKPVELHSGRFATVS